MNCKCLLCVPEQELKPSNLIAKNYIHRPPLRLFESPSPALNVTEGFFLFFFAATYRINLYYLNDFVFVGLWTRASNGQLN